MNLLIIIVVLFASLFLISKVLEGRAKPLSPEQASKLSRWAMIAIGTLLVFQLLRHLIA